MLHISDLHGSIISSLKDGLFAFDLEFKCLAWNSAMEKMTGEMAAGVLGRTVFDVLPSLEATGEDKYLKLAVAGQNSNSVSFSYSCGSLSQPANQPRLCDVSYTHQADAKGRVTGGVGVVRDVTGDRQILDHLPQMVWVCNPSGLNTYTSRYGLDYLGISLEQSKNIGWADFVHPDDLNHLFQRWQDSLHTGKPLESETRIKRAKDGSYRWTLMRGFPVMSRAGEIIEWVGTSTDIHEQKLATERAIQIQSVTTALTVAVTADEVAEIIITEVAGALGAHSATLAHLTSDQDLQIIGASGYDSDTIQEWRKVPLTTPVPLAESALTGLAVFVESVESAQKRYPMVEMALTKYKERAYAALPLLIDRKVTGSIGFGFTTDQLFTEGEKRFMGTLAGVCAQAYERACLYEKEKLARSSAEQASEAKSRFLGSVSHEIRTPLTAIMGFAELLQKPRENSQNYIDGIIRHSMSLIHILDDFLDLTAAEAGRLRIRKEPLEISSLLEDVLNTVRQLADKDEVSLTYDQQHKLPSTIFSDQTRLKQVLLNVVGNAVKFTEKGQVSIISSIRPSEDTGEPLLEFTISDTGIGMTQEDAKGLFEPFTQAKSALVARPTGRGLGLAIGRRIARALGGELELLESEQGIGSVFRLSIAFQLPEANLVTLTNAGASSSPAEHARLKINGKSILLAEDEEDIRHLLQAIIEHEGATVTCASNGNEAVDFAASGAFDLIMMDLQMPLLDGYEAAKKIRGSGFSGPLLALSAHVTEHYRTKALSCGFTAYVAKPVKARELLQLMASLL